MGSWRVEHYLDSLRTALNGLHIKDLIIAPALGKVQSYNILVVTNALKNKDLGHLS